jgi:hypothetical protein
VVFETDSSQVIASVKARISEEPANPCGGSPVDPAFVLGSTLDRNLAATLNAGLLTVSYPVTNRVITDQAYAGFRGGLRLATDLLSVILSPRQQCRGCTTVITGFVRMGEDDTKKHSGGRPPKNHRVTCVFRGALC